MIPRILYVPGVRAKPSPAVHRAMLWRCLVEGVRRADAEAAAALAAAPETVRLALWGHLLYSQYRDERLDEPGIAALVADVLPGRDSIREVFGMKSRTNYLVHRFGDRYLGLIDLLAPEETRINIAESERYFRNVDGVGDRIREILRRELLRSWAAGERVLLMAHSFGSIIAWDTLWTLRGEGGVIDLFLTLGSPLGTNYIQRRLMGAKADGAARYPTSISRWQNLAAVGDLTALGHRFATDFAEMQRLGLIAGISDRMDLRNPYRDAEGLNVHRCYGYFVNRVTGQVISDWWRSAGIHPD